ncbi:uncharacterized protein LODBEIA_P26160 [Lodderomyces beijingensis]|uniref:Peptide hydrolase n=1 Tax=Lodderomyces beijingensis TaxID=1775926 RepID=A0ABP0ZM04_9ASCO
MTASSTGSAPNEASSSHTQNAATSNTATHGSTLEGHEPGTESTAPSSTNTDDGDAPKPFTASSVTDHTANERSLLLPHAQAGRGAEEGRDDDDHEDDDDDDDDDRMSRIIKLAKRPSFIWIYCLGILAVVIFELTFLPRTSLARDYRRWYGIRLTKSDVKRNFLQMTGIGKSHANLTTEEFIDNWLRNFTVINNKAKFNLISDDNPALVHYVESNFKNFGFKTEKFTYDAPIPEPQSSSLRLLDTEGNIAYQCDVLETSFKTPAFYDLGASGSVTAPFVFVNEGTPADYHKLIQFGVALKDKIFIIKSPLQEQNITIGEKLALAQHHGASGILTYFEAPKSGNEDSMSANLRFGISRGCNNHKIKIPAIPISKKLVTPVLETSITPVPEFEAWDYSPTTTSKFKLEINATFAEGAPPRKLTNVVGTLKGIMNDADVIIGARRDSLTSNNPLSGHAILFEIMRNYQRLISQGWKPLRNIKFISWDASNSDLLGVEMLTNDTYNFNPKRSIVAYINIDGDAVTGSNFAVDANPLLNHLLRDTSKFIPIPKEAAVMKTLSDLRGADNGNNNNNNNIDGNDNDNGLGNDDDDDNGEDYTTLYRYWLKQDNLTINNILGWPIISSEAKIYQQHLSTPIINLKFTNNEKRDSAKYIANSNYYSREWLIKQSIDNNLLLHGSLIRFIGLLGISLSEHEVVDYKTFSYFKKISAFYDTLLSTEQEKLAQWNKTLVPSYLIYKHSIFQDLDTDDPVDFDQIVTQFTSFMVETVQQSRIFDKWNIQVEDGLTRDYPWYMYYKKFQHFAQFKVSNYKLSHLERDLKVSDLDYTYLSLREPPKIEHEVTSLGKVKGIFDGKPENKLYYDSVIYGNPKFSVKNNATWYEDRLTKSTFTYLYEAIDSGDYESTVKWFVLVYEKLKNIQYKMT